MASRGWRFYCCRSGGRVLVGKEKKENRENEIYTWAWAAPTLHGCMAAGAISLSLPFSPFKRTRYLPSETIIANRAIKLRLVIKFHVHFHFKFSPVTDFSHYNNFHCTVCRQNAAVILPLDNLFRGNSSSSKTYQKGAFSKKKLDQFFLSFFDKIFIIKRGQNHFFNRSFI